MVMYTTHLLSSAVFICTLYWLTVLVTGLWTFSSVEAVLGFSTCTVFSFFFEAMGLLMAERPVAKGADLGRAQAPAWVTVPGMFWGNRLWETDTWTGFSVAFSWISETDFGLDDTAEFTLGLVGIGREETDLDRTLGHSGFGLVKSGFEITFFSVVFSSALGFLKQSILDCTIRPLYIPGLDFWMAETLEGGFWTSFTRFLCLTVCCVRKAWLNVLHLVGSAFVLVFGLTSFSFSLVPELSSLRSFFNWRGADLHITFCFDTIPLMTCFFGPHSGLVFSLLLWIEIKEQN